MASVLISPDRTLMEGQITMKTDFSVVPIISYILTWLLCNASASSVEKNVYHAIGYTILTHLVNLVQLSLWEAHIFKSSKKSRKVLQEASSMGLTWTSHSQQRKMTLAIPSIVLYSIYLDFAFVLSFLSSFDTFQKSIVVGLGMSMISLRSTLALVMLWLPSKWVRSMPFNLLCLLTGLKLCEGIFLSKEEEDDSSLLGDEEWEKVESAAFSEEGNQSESR